MSKKNKNQTIQQNPNEEQKVKDHRVFKKVMKFTALFLATIVVVFLGATAYAYMSKKINPEKIYITELSIEGQKEYVTISENDKSFKTTVSFLPENANQLNLTTKIVTGKNLIETIPVVTAGEEFEIVFAKDDRGITKGGEIEIKFLDSSQSAYATLKVLIDVGLNSNYINVSTNGDKLTEENNVLSTSVFTSQNEEYAHVLKINALNDEMFNSYKGNWSESENNSVANLNRLKKMLLFYDEKDLSIQGFATDKKLEVEEVVDEEKYYLIKFLAPVSSIEPFKLDVYIYKTYYMETIFPESMAKELVDAINGGGIASINYDRLNLFINNYVINNCSPEAQSNFAVFREDSTGLIILSPHKTPGKMIEFRKALQDVVDFAMVGKRINITVENIEVDNIDNAKGSSAIEFQVLKNMDFDISKVNTDLGITLTSDDINVDRGVLYNNLRRLEILLCKKVEPTDAQFNFDGVSCTREVNNKNEYFELTKTMTEGVANWNLKTLSPTPTYTDYYLVYRYRNNDITEATINDKDYLYNKDNETWYNLGKNGDYGSQVTQSTILTKLNEKFEDVYSVSRIITTYNGGSIAFNQSVKNYDSTNFVLNESVSRYVDTPNSKLEVVNNGDYAVYYGTRDFKVSGPNANVVITPTHSDKDMEYTMIKWFVPYVSNFVGLESAGDLGTYDLNKAQYYFLPTLDSTYSQNEQLIEEGGTEYKNFNPIPYKVKLSQVGKQNSYLGGDSGYFMEVGMNDFTLRALNAMKNDGDNPTIPLYAAIIQTDINGNPYKKNETDFIAGDYYNNGKATEVIYHYIAATDLVGSSGHDIRSDYYVEDLKFFIAEGSSAFVESSEENTINLSTTSSASSGVMYLSNFDLSATTTVLTAESIYDDETNDIILLDAINILRNQELALINYCNNFFYNKTKKSYVAEPLDKTGDYSTNVYKITIGEDGAKNAKESLTKIEEGVGGYAIKFTIECTGVSTDCIYTIRTAYLDPVNNIIPPVSSNNNQYFFTTVESSNLGIFTLYVPSGSL